MVSYTKRCMLIMLCLVSSSYAADYYLKNDLPFAVNVQVECGSAHETLAIGGGVTAYFRVMKCKGEPMVSVTAAGTMASDSLKSVQKKSLSKPYARLYLDKNKSLSIEILSPAQDLIEQENIQNYDLVL